MLWAEIKLSPTIGQSELRWDNGVATRSPRSQLLTVTRDHATGVVLVLVGRIYYRQDLQQRWGIELDDNLAVPSDWAMAAYLAGAESALNTLEGEFSLMVYDPRMRTLYLHRSVFSDVPLYWTCDNTGVLAGTSLRSLAAQMREAKLNHDYLAMFIVDSYTATITETTAISAIRRVLPGTRLSIDTAGKTKFVRFWNWTRYMQESSNLGRAEAAPQYLTLLKQSVLERMYNAPTAAELSGGFDSSTVVCLAREQLVRLGSDKPLLTVSLDYLFPEMASEGQYMRLITDQGGPIEPVFLRAEAALDYDGFPHEVPLHDEPSAYLFRFALDRQMLDLASKWGANTLLTGGGAEILVEPRMEYLTDLARSGKWRQAWREARGWALDRRTTIGALIRQHMLTPFLPPSLQQGWQLWRSGGVAEVAKLEYNTIAPWINPDFMRHTDMLAKILANIRQRTCAPTAIARTLADLHTSADNWAGWYLGIQRNGILLSHPFQDPRLLIFGLNLHRKVRQEPGQVKPLLAMATYGILPEPIRTRRYKCGFDRVNIDGFRRALPRIRALLSDTVDCDSDIIDRTKLEHAVLTYSQGLGNAIVGGHIATALSLLVWLKQLQDQPPCQAMPTQTLRLAC